MKVLPDIQRITQINWMKRTITKELIDGQKADVGTANEIRLIRVLELIDWYVEKYGPPVK
jgi:hypothetical protein